MKSMVNVSAKYSERDEGLRKYMISIFKHMSMALFVTAITAFIVSNVPALMQLIFGTPLYLVVMFAPLFYVFYFTSKIWTMSAEKARNNLWIYSVLMGLSLTSIFLAYSSVSLFRTFIITATTFAGMALYGNTTKKDLTGFGSFLLMGLFGIIVASVVNIFLKSVGIEFSISIIGVLLFTGLTAYDVQKLKNTYDYVGVNNDTLQKVAIIGALNLYMDFINLFLMLLRLIGDRK
ncbi:MAG: Bax inhibitor-1/YccA family protein [Rickettsiales bacterium]|jgi:FtsH-binding integral membrane protein|nr:Bax inhibitor-1/YccA family protein [Rickettsiales bacterium]